jgi:hypothetical protein
VPEETRSPVVELGVPVIPVTLTTLPVTAFTPPPETQGTVPLAAVESANQDCATPGVKPAVSYGVEEVMLDLLNPAVAKLAKDVVKRQPALHWPVAVVGQVVVGQSAGST